jgi:hypothetical protein
MTRALASSSATPIVSSAVSSSHLRCHPLAWDWYSLWTWEDRYKNALGEFLSRDVCFELLLKSANERPGLADSRRLRSCRSRRYVYLPQAYAYAAGPTVRAFKMSRQLTIPTGLQSSSMIGMHEMR